MYVCVCQAVTENEIREAADEGLSSVQELGHCLGVATGCGQCASMASDILDDQRRTRAGYCQRPDSRPAQLIPSPA